MNRLDKSFGDARPLTNRIAFGLFVILSLGFAAGCSPQSTRTSQPAPVAVTSPPFRVVPLDEFSSQIPPQGTRTLIDLRTPEETANGVIKGSRLINFNSGDFAKQLEALDRTKPYAIYCRSGNRSAKAGALMTEMGFSDVIDLEGGVQAWTDAGNTLVSAD